MQETIFIPARDKLDDPSYILCHYLCFYYGINCWTRRRIYCLDCSDGYFQKSSTQVIFSLLIGQHVSSKKKKVISLLCRDNLESTPYSPEGCHRWKGFLVWMAQVLNFSRNLRQILAFFVFSAFLRHVSF